MKVLSTRKIEDFKPVFRGLVPDFGYVHYDSILEWCGIIDLEFKEYWEMWCIKDKSGVDGHTIGICGLYKTEDQDSEQYWLGWLGVLLEYRRNGVGTEAIEFLEGEVRRMSGKTIMVYCSETALPFYTKNGFKFICRVKEYKKKNMLSSKRCEEYFENDNDFVLQLKLV